MPYSTQEIFRITRDTLQANRTYYVDPTGSDSNDGLSPGASGAFLTIQKAVDVVATLDLSIYDATIQLADGTYVLSTFVTLKDPVGAGNVIITGNSGDKTLVVVDGGAAASRLFNAARSTKTIIEFLTGTNATQSFVWNGTVGSLVVVRDVRCLDIAAASSRAFYGALPGGTIFLQNTIDYDDTTGGTDNLINCLALGATVDAQGATINITGNPNFADALCACFRNSSANLVSATATGAFTGTGLKAEQSSVIIAQGASGFGSSSTATDGFIHT